MRDQARPTARKPGPDERGGALLQVTVVFVAALALLVGVAFVTGLIPGDSRSTPPPGATSLQEFPPIAGIPCQAPVEDGFSAQALLIIRVDGRQQTVPGGIGKRTPCRYWLHTISSQGVIHVDAPAEQSFALGQFFDVWLEPLDSTRIGEHMASGDQAVFAFVNGEAWNDDPRAIPLKNRTIIELQLGVRPAEPLDVPFPSE